MESQSLEGKLQRIQFRALGSQGAYAILVNFAPSVLMKMDGKISFLLPFLYFLVEMGSGSENTGMETGSGYAEVRKQTNTDVEPERITRSNILKYTLTKSENNIHVRNY